MLKNTYTAIKAILVYLLIINLQACGGGGGSSGGGSSGGTVEIPPDSTATISGTAKFERVPITANGLSYSGIVEQPIRKAVVKLITSSGAVAGTTTTDLDGAYSIKAANNTKYKIRVYSETLVPNMSVQDNFNPDSTTNENAVYAIESADVTTTSGDTTANLLAKSGWSITKNDFASSRQSAPFAILDSCLKATLFFEGQDIDSFARLLVNWSTKNSTSTIGTSSWTGEALYILGDANQDTDEFDEHIIVHEWGHYFESKLGRTDSNGGPHTDGDILEPSVALSEGWGNALSAMVLYPDTVYKDSSGLRQSQTGISFDVDNNKEELSINAGYQVGWYSENSVQQILFDLYDSSDASEPFDQVSTTSDVIFKVFNEKLKNADSLTTIFTFINGFNELQPASVLQVADLLAEHQIKPVVDEFGTGETNNGGLDGVLPLYNSIVLGQSVSLKFNSFDEDNLLATFRYLKITGVSGKATISVSGSTSFNSALVLFNKGDVLGSDGGLGTLLISGTDFDSSKTYIVRVSGFGPTDTVSATLTKE